MKLAEDTKEAFLMKMESIAADPTARFAPKGMLPEYRRQEIRVTVSSPLDQLHVPTQCYVRTVCVEEGLLRSLRSEDDMAGSTENAKIGIDPEVARCSCVTRQTLAGTTDDDAATSGNIRETFRAKSNCLTSADHDWRIEQGFWVSMPGSPVERKVQRLKLNISPSRTR